MSVDSIIGWDIGGAHLKTARIDGARGVVRVAQLACPLWQGMDSLHAALAAAETATGAASLHAVTMTGEMTDLFADRRAGVSALVSAMEARFRGARLRYYAGALGFLDAAAARAHAASVASANWHASATFAARQVSDALFVDIGSTTTDITPIAGGRVDVRGSDDAQRLAAEELIYTGVLRTPLMALARSVPFAGEWIPVMAEHFATTADIYRLTGRLVEATDQQPTADREPKTLVASARRLARMIGRDAECAPLEDWVRLAGWLAAAQLRRIEDACARILTRAVVPAAAPLVAAGAGRFLAVELARRMGRPLCDFADLVQVCGASRDWVSTCAPAVAVAGLSQESFKL